MAAKKTPSTVKTLQAKPKVAAKTATTKSAGRAKKKVDAKKSRSKIMVLEERTAAEQATSKKTSLDALRFFVKTYANL